MLKALKQIPMALVKAAVILLTALLVLLYNSTRAQTFSFKPAITEQGKQ